MASRTGPGPLKAVAVTSILPEPQLRCFLLQDTATDHDVDGDIEEAALLHEAHDARALCPGECRPARPRHQDCAQCMAAVDWGLARRCRNATTSHRARRFFAPASASADRKSVV